jgi:O-antigen/teichoic acid export membrane protein
MVVSVARGTLLNLLGHVAPLIAALAAVPLLVTQLEPARFGFLSLAWVIVGYFGLFDLGLGRALTRLIAERMGTPREPELPVLARTALLVLSGLGCVAGGLLFAIAPWLCSVVLKLPAGLQAEAASGLQALALCLPFVTLTAALRGMLEAGQRFGWVNALRVPLGVLTFLVPVAVTSYTPDLFAVCLALAVLRVIGSVAHWLVCVRLYPALMRLGAPSRQGFAEMFGYGMWLTVSNVVGPLMVYLDRFVIGALVSVAAVAYYTAPYEVVTRLWLVPAALTGVLFPVFAGSFSADPQRTRRIYRKAIIVLAAAMLPLTLVMALGADFWLTVWLGADYAREGIRVAQILSVGVFFNSLAHLPFSLLQAAGRADWTAKLHVLELPLYIAALAWLVPAWGIDGAALVWTGRCMLDAAVLFVLARRQMHPSGVTPTVTHG